MSRRWLLVPSTAKGNGSGHLVRCLGLARELGPSASIYLPGSKTGAAWSSAEIGLAYARELEGLSVVEDLSLAGPVDLVVLDRRAVSREELAFWESFGPVVALDEGGPARHAAPYLVDILPRLDHDAANLREAGFLDLPRNRRDPPASFSRVLVSFGGEDPAGLSVQTARALLEGGLVDPARLTVVGGPLMRGFASPPGGRPAPEGGAGSEARSVLERIVVLGPVQGLKEHFAQYDLVITQFGLTAFEAAWAGCGVILVNPSAYHRALGRRAGFPDGGLRKPRLQALRRHFASPEATIARSAAACPAERHSLAERLSALAPAGPRSCPRCGSPERDALYRSASKSFFRCGACGIVYLLRFSAGREEPYKKSYFFEEYRQQYGRSYLEDWPTLTGLAESRLGRIEALAARELGRSRSLTVLDVGCAYGPFLAAAKSHGQEPYGLDMAEDAATYVRVELGIPAIAGDFLDPAAAMSFGGPFDVLTMWYVIEHFADLDRALRNAAALVRPGGILALATPSGEGISARSDFPRFLERSPDDHFTLWEPSRVASLLKAYGFRVELVRSTGHHPERFPLLKALAAGPLGRVAPLAALLRAAADAVSKACGLGDTFEVYAVRESASPAGSGRRGAALRGRSGGALGGPASIDGGPHPSRSIQE
jgi:2-polyprenyl-3-methyl-5-hydroxy-6-metoxy-1,4-benzoquinol methylase/spore coat polysaccharide biosynthesis predicted glycosyltransferase SpsG